MANEDKKKSSQAKYVVLSLVIAAILWGLVTYVIGPDISRTLHNLPVNYIGAGELARNGLVLVQDANSQDLSVDISGKRSDIIELLDNVRIDVDVSDITEAGEYTLDGTVRLPGAKLSVEKVNFSSVTVTVEASVEKEIPLTIKSDSINGKFVKSVPDVTSVTVSGAESELENIGSAYVFVAFEGEPENSEMSLPVDFADKDGNELRLSDSVRCLTPHVRVTNTIYDSVTLPVELDTSALIQSGYYYNAADAQISPKQMTVGIVPGSDIKHVTAVVSSAASGEPFDCVIKEEEGLYIPEDSKTVKVTLDLYPLSD